MFNPCSVVKAFSRGECLNYWTSTGPFTEIADCIGNNVDAERRCSETNHELMERFNLVLTRPSFGSIKEIVDQSKRMLEATLHQDGEIVASILEMVHDQENPFLVYKDENSLACVVTLCYLYARSIMM